MAKNPNRTRMRDSRFVVIIALALTLGTKASFPTYHLNHEWLELLGYGLIIIGALGRIYSSAFLGGFKNNTVIADGPFSIVRNPLYLCSLIGVTGVSLISLHLPVIIFAPTAFLLIYLALIKREEAHLADVLASLIWITRRARRN